MLIMQDISFLRQNYSIGGLPGALAPYASGSMAQNRSEVARLAEEILVVGPHSEHIAKGCPTCRRGIEAGQTIAICLRCRTVHHEECWFKEGGCGVIGCKGVASKRDRDQLGRPAARTEGPEPEHVDPVSPEASQLPGWVYAIVAIIFVFLIYFFFIR
jgi:hypothetical protein